MKNLYPETWHKKETEQDKPIQWWGQLNRWPNIVDAGSVVILNLIMNDAQFVVRYRLKFT